MTIVTLTTLTDPAPEPDPDPATAREPVSAQEAVPPFTAATDRRISPRLPTGAVTFLFTDIEGSTKLWEAHPQAMQPALARHDALLREAIHAAGGVVFKTVGDAFCAAFSTPNDALHAALDAQRALGAEFKVPSSSPNDLE
ncbi:MAG: adenylate/guanylate cyclase domain-containing protein, partial [Cytophagales bacterium]|nr:adenylate/guanylate cyclase domain-containing protein [Armatimonadota bacterium]